MTKPLTHKQERFAQLVADGRKHSEAYRQAYDVSPDTSPNTVWVNACKLAADTKVALRIAELRQAAAVAERREWDLERLVDEAETNLYMARAGGPKSIASANGALESIGRATGLLSDKPQQPQAPRVTRITVVLNRGADAEGQRRVVEAEEYRVLPPAPELPPDGEGEYREVEGG